MPLTDKQLVQAFKDQLANGESGPMVIAVLIGEHKYTSAAQIEAQLRHAGVSKTGVHQLVTAQPSFLQTILSAGAGVLFVPGSVADALLGGGADAAGGGAAAGATGAAGGGAAEGAAAGSGATALGSKTLQDLVSKYGSNALFLPIIVWLTKQKNWVRVLEYIGGAAMIAIAMRELAQQ